MNKRKVLIAATGILVTIILVIVLLMIAINQDKKSGADPTESDQTTEAPTEESTEPTEPEVKDENVPETANSLIVSSFDGDKDKAYLEKYGLITYESPIAIIDGVNGLQYVDIGDGVEIYYQGQFCGWFAAWNFGDVSAMGGEETISGENIDAYIERHIGGVNTAGVTRLGEEKLSGKVMRYDYEVKVLAVTGNDWMVTNGIYDSKEEMLERSTYTLNVSAYCKENSNFGYILCTEATVVDRGLAEKLAGAISFWSNSFDKGRTTLEIGNAAQEIYIVVAEKYPAVERYVEICQWFEDYNGEKLHRIPGTADDNYSPATCPDIVFYRPDKDEDMDDVVKAMFKAIMEPLKEKSDKRPFTVTKYFLAQQEIRNYEGRENTWLLPYLNGYYAYEGKDVVSMETAKTGGNVQEGMVPLFRQGSDENFQFVLMREGNVFRLQRAVDMGLEVETKEK